MDKEKWTRITGIIDKALAMEPSEQEAFVKKACEGDEKLLEEIQEQLHYIREAEDTGFLSSLADERQTFIKGLRKNWSQTGKDTGIIGRQFGSFTITECLGEGGMGAVYKAERAEGDFSQTVAIKLIKQDVVSEETIHRFKMERDILARLRHPFIAQLYDAGFTGEGQPYLVMEYIGGLAIDRWCNKHRCSIGERLGLFRKVCQAVLYAHQNLVVHRDIKPQNILITETGQVKVLDFGIAKLLSSDSLETSLFETRVGRKLWTPQYAAPEQVEGSTISIATDIYALGSLLYLLLSGYTPYDFSDKTTRQVEQIIRNDDPEPPSRKLSAGFAKTYKVPEAEKPGKIQKTIRGDLDAMALKAMRRNPHFRYASVDELLDDLKSYCEDLPVKARAGTFRYRSAKYWKRHRWSVSAAIIVAISLIGGFSVALWQANVAATERDEARLQSKKTETVVQYLTGLFNSSDPNYKAGETITARDLLDRGAQQIEEMDNQPAIEANMLVVIGEMYQNLGLYKKSKQLFERAFQINRNQFGIENSGTVESLIKLIGIHNLLEETDKVQKLFAIVQEHNLLQTAEFDIETVFLLRERGRLATREGKYDSAGIWYRRAFDRYDRVDSEDKDPVYRSLLLNDIGFSLENTGHYKEALNFYQESQKEVNSQVGEYHTISAVAFENIGRAYRKLNMLDSATYYNNKALNIRLALLGDQHEQVAESHFNAALIAREKGNTVAAKEHLQKAEQIYRHTLSDSSRFIGLVQMLKGELYLAENDTNRAESILLQSLNIFKTTLRTDHPLVKRNMELLRKIAALQSE